MIELCLSLFPWARFRKREGAVRLHTLLDLRGNIPTIIVITHAKVHEVNILDEIPFDAGAFYILDRAYLSFPRLYKIHQAAAFFVTRARSDFRFERLYSHPVDKATGLRCDQTIGLCSFYPRKDYPERLRRIRFYDTELDRRFVFLTNNFTLSALTIAQIYKCRWQIELFFKWIKCEREALVIYVMQPLNSRAKTVGLPGLDAAGSLTFPRDYGTFVTLHPRLRFIRSEHDIRRRGPEDNSRGNPSPRLRERPHHLGPRQRHRRGHRIGPRDPAAGQLGHGRLCRHRRRHGLCKQSKARRS